MRTKNFLIFSFLFVVAVPFLIFGTWSYYTSLHREIERAQERHLLLARNLSASLERYSQDLIGTLEIIFRALLTHKRPDNLHTLLATLDIQSTFILNESSGTLLQLADIDPSILNIDIPAHIIRFTQSQAKLDKIIFSTVIEFENKNVILAMRRYGNNLAVAIISTDYFIELGKSISFGRQGYAALFDNLGNVLYHPNRLWVSQRKNLSFLEVVQNMLGGETGVKHFYSPSLNKEMIAAITHVPIVNWGVMIPQPIDELYAQIGTHNNALLLALAVGSLLSFILIMAFVNSLAKPFDRFLATMRAQAKKQQLEPINIENGIISLREVHEITVSYNSLVEQISQAKNKVEKIAFHDELTALPNRAQLLKLSKKILTDFQNQQNKYQGGLFIFIDLDDFKTINDNHGHALGDAFLRDTSQILLQVVKKTRILYALNKQDIPAPIVARIGGDEFACLLPGLVKYVDVYNFLQELQRQFSKPCALLPSMPKHRASIGAARYPVDTNKLDELMKFSDIAMYNAKRSIKSSTSGCFQIYSKKIGTKTIPQILNSIERGLKQGEFKLSYQPIFSSQSGEVKMYDVIVNWVDKTNGIVESQQWQNALVSSPLARQLIELVFTNSLKYKEKNKNVVLCYDLSYPFLKTFDAVAMLAQKIRLAKFENKDFVISFSQQAILKNNLLDNKILKNYSAAGFNFALSNIGKGYLDFVESTKAPISYFAFAESLTSRASSVENIAAILCCLIDMAKELKIKTIARKIENSAQANFLKTAGIDYIDYLQGKKFTNS